MKPPYTPDMAALLREADPARRKEYQRKAREDMARPTPAGFFQAAEDTDTPDGDAPRTNPSSPEAERQWPATWKLVGALVLVVVASLGIALGVFVGERKEPRGPAEGAASAVPSAATVTVPSAAVVVVVPSAAVVVPSAAAVTPSSTATASPRLGRPSRPPASPAPRPEPSDSPKDKAVPSAPKGAGTTADPGLNE